MILGLEFDILNSSRSILQLRRIKGKCKPDPNHAVGQFGTDRAAVRFDQFLDDGQANAGAAVLP